MILWPFVTKKHHEKTVLNLSKKIHELSSLAANHEHEFKVTFAQFQDYKNTMRYRLERYEKRIDKLEKAIRERDGMEAGKDIVFNEHGGIIYK